MEKHLHIVRKLVSFLMLILVSNSYAQIADGFTSWTQRNANGNYTQTTSQGVWQIINSRVFKNSTGNLPALGLVEINKRLQSENDGGSLITPIIAKGGAKSIELSLLIRVNTSATYAGILEVQKRVDEGDWITIETISVNTSSVVNHVIPVNDTSDNLQFRLLGKSIYNPVIVDVLDVNHDFVLSSDNSTVCKDSPVVLTANSSAPFNYTWSSSAGGNLAQSTGSSVTANPSQPATYTAVGTYTTPFGTVTETKTINVGIKTAPTATLTGGGTIDTEPGSVNLVVQLTGTAPWSITYTANGANPQTISGINTSPFVVAVSPETDTNYSITSISDVECSTGTAVGIASALVNKTVWRELAGVTNWSNGLPNASLNTYFLEPYSTAVNGSFIANNVNVDGNGALTVNPNTVITANQYINNRTADKFVVESDANIMQSSNLSNSGNITVNRVANMAQLHYIFWSSPVANQNLYAFTDGGLVGGTPKNRIFMYNESNDYFVTTGLNDNYNFRTGQGYAIRGKDSYSTNFNNPSPYTFSFAGTPNNGNLAYQYLKWTNADHGFNLVGNPYPSNLDFDALYDANSSLIYGTAFFWTNQQFIEGQQGSDYEGSNYAIYNRSGGVPSTFQDGVASPTPTQYIKVGQGFLVQSMSGSNNQPLQFSNDMRSYSASSIFFNKQEAKSKDRFWLNLKSPSNINNTILLSYMPGATDGYEKLYDADLLVVGSDAFYSINGSAKLAIQGRSFPLNSNDVVTIGTKYHETGNYTISLNEKEGIFNNDQAVYLKDKKLNKIINLTLDGSYKFNATKGIDETRFEVIYQDTTSFESANRSAGGVSVVKDDLEVIVKHTTDMITAIDVFDASGKLVQKISGKNAKEIRINTVGLLKGFYILKITSDKGVFTKKVIL